MNRLLFFIFLFISFNVSGQSISGIVIDTDSDPLPGATVQILGSNYFELTDAFGKFTMDLRGIGDLLVIQYVGYASDTVKAEKGKFLKVVLSPNIQLEEIIVNSNLVQNPGW